MAGTIPVLAAGAVGVNSKDRLYEGDGGPLRTVAEQAARVTAAFLAAGADGVFVPGAVDPETMRPLVDGVDGELKVRAGPGGRRSPNWPNSASYA